MRFFIISLSCFFFSLTFAKADESRPDLYAYLDNQPQIYDPAESLNRKIFAFNLFFDDYFLSPIARVYNAITPDDVNRGVSNFFANTTQPFNSVNHLLQGEVKKSGKSFLRFLVNSTLGVFGLFDPAKHLGLEHKKSYGLGKTLETWGVGPGPYLVLPIIGPTTFRDMPVKVGSLMHGKTLETLFLFPVSDEDEFFASLIQLVDLRADLLDSTRTAKEARLDLYDLQKEFYFQYLKSGQMSEQELLEENTKDELDNLEDAFDELDFDSIE